MSPQTLQISLETLIAASPLLGHELEDRSPIQHAQDPDLVRHWQDASSIPLNNADQQQLFCVAPLDLLVTDVDGEKQFHLLELNGTGIGGLTNLTTDAVNAVLQSLGQMAAPQLETDTDPLILIASSGKESETNPRLNRLIYEKLLYAEALKQGFASCGESATLAAMPSLLNCAAPLQKPGPAIVVGYIKEFLDALKVEADGRLSLFGRTVTGAVNDRFCLNVLNQFEGLVDLSQFATMNRCHLAGADKGVAYDLMNDCLKANPVSYFPSSIPFDITYSRDDLIATVLKWRRRGLRPVIKPHGTGLGHGIEFFLANEPASDVLKKIDRSIQLTQEYYRAAGGAFPYTVCEYVDACKISRPEHPLFEHKYELRVVVYREEMMLRAYPSIVKVASEPFDPQRCDGTGLINNITASCLQTKAKGTDYMLPLANCKTLELLGLDESHLTAVCTAATGYVRYILDQVQEQPQRLGLPAVSYPFPATPADPTIRRSA
jgi:hypothetical protein